MAKKIRKDNKGRVLRKGETYIRNKELYCFTYTDAFGKRGCFYSKDLLSLREKEKQYERNRLDGMDLCAMSKTTLDDLFDLYMGTKRDLRSTTYSNYLYMYDRFVRGGFGKKLIANIRYSDVLRFYQSLLERELTIGSIRLLNCVIHPAFQMAVRDNIIRTNPSDGVMPQLRQSVKKRTVTRHALTLEQERRFLDFVKNDEDAGKWSNLYVVMFGTGCRIGEIIGLRWEDVDFSSRIITIDHNITYSRRADKAYKCEHRLSLPKTDAGIRTIPMIDEVYKALLDEKRSQNNGDVFCTAEIEGMSGFIFCSRSGNLLNSQLINHTIKKHVDDCNAKEIVSAEQENREPVIVPRFSCHIARHTFCSRLCENEVNVKVIQSVMGHRHVGTTLDIYAEVADRKKKESLLKLDNAGMIM